MECKNCSHQIKFDKWQQKWYHYANTGERWLVCPLTVAEPRD